MKKIVLFAILSLGLFSSAYADMGTTAETQIGNIYALTWSVGVPVIYNSNLQMYWHNLNWWMTVMRATPCILDTTPNQWWYSTIGTFWNIIAWSLPEGLHINSSTCEISGTPTRAGNFTFDFNLWSGNYWTPIIEFVVLPVVIVSAPVYVSTSGAILHINSSAYSVLNSSSTIFVKNSFLSIDLLPYLILALSIIFILGKIFGIFSFWTGKKKE
jgi:hypothetical protein